MSSSLSGPKDRRRTNFEVLSTTTTKIIQATTREFPKVRSTLFGGPYNTGRRQRVSRSRASGKRVTSVDRLGAPEVQLSNYEQ